MWKVSKRLPLLIVELFLELKDWKDWLGWFAFMFMWLLVFMLGFMFLELLLFC